MSQIVGTLLDSAGNPLTGKLVVVLAGNLIDDSTTPDTIYLTQSYTFDIADGDLDIDLQESETLRITYNFQFFKTDDEGEIIEPALINFNAIVPNVSPVQFASLTPTGFVNDVIDTGAIRIARIISNTPALAQNIGGPFPQGEYNPSTTYKFRDLVTYLNRTYISKDLNPITGVAPTNTTSWMNIPVEPDGSLILADATPYGVAWNASGKSASQDAVYDQVEDVKSNVALKANLISPIFSGNVLAPTAAVNDKTTKVATTSFVSSQTDRYFKVIRTTDASTSTDLVIAWSALDYSANCNFVSTYLEVPENGIYLFGGSIYFTNSDSGASRTLGAFIQVNGADIIRVCEANIPASSSRLIPICPTQMKLLAGQQVRIKTTNFGGSNTYLIVGDPSVTNWWGQKVASF